MTDTEESVFVQFVPFGQRSLLADPTAAALLPSFAATPIQLSLATDRAQLLDILRSLLDDEAAGTTDSGPASVSADQEYDLFVRGDAYSTVIVGTLLRPLGEEIRTRRLSLEDVVVIEYAARQEAPVHRSRSPAVPDWISTVLVVDQNSILCGCFDGTVRLYIVADNAFHPTTLTNSVKAVTHLALTKFNGDHVGVGGSTKTTSTILHLLVSSKDGIVRQWQLHYTASPTVSWSFSAELSYVGHQASVECVAANPRHTLFCSGSWDSVVRVWEIPAGSVVHRSSDSSSSQSSSLVDDEHAAADVKGKSGKRKRQLLSQNNNTATNTSSSSSSSSSSSNSSVSFDRLPKKDALKIYSGHMDRVSAVVWPHHDHFHSGSWDRSIRSWDVTSGTCTMMKTSDKAVFSLTYLPDHHAIVSGHEDRIIRVWDSRDSDRSIPSMSMKSHTHWVSSLSAPSAFTRPLTGCPSAPGPGILTAQFVSGSYDATVNLWDIRSTKPVHSVPAGHSDKVFSVDWHPNASHIASGGVDAQMSVSGWGGSGVDLE